MKTQRLLMIAALLALGPPLISTGAQSQAYRFQEAIHLMETKGDYPVAIELFEEIALGSDRALAARALLNVGRCSETLGEAEAVTAYQRITQDFTDQLAVVAQARRRLERLEPRQAGRGVAVVDGGARYRLALTLDIGAFMVVDPKGFTNPRSRQSLVNGQFLGYIRVSQLRTAQIRLCYRTFNISHSARNRLGICAGISRSPTVG